MPAFNETLTKYIVSNIRQLFYRRSQVGDLHLTDEEYLQTFVPAISRELFREVTPMVAKVVTRHRFEMHVRNELVSAVMTLHGTTSVLVPRHLMVQPDAPGEVVSRIASWIENGADVSRDFGRVMRVFDMLNRQHSRVSMRYYWPTILALCSESSDTKDLVKELQELRTPTTLKQLPPGLAKACRQTAATIATARLLPTDTTATSTPSEGVSFGIVRGQTYTEEFGQFTGET